MLQKNSTSDIVLRYRLLKPKHTTDNPGQVIQIVILITGSLHPGTSVMRSAQWSTNEHIYYVKDIRLPKIESVTNNVSGTANQLLPTKQNAKNQEHQVRADQ